MSLKFNRSRVKHGSATKLRMRQSLISGTSLDGLAPTGGFQLPGVVLISLALLINGVVAGEVLQLGSHRLEMKSLFPEVLSDAGAWQIQGTAARPSNGAFKVDLSAGGTMTGWHHERHKGRQVLRARVQVQPGSEGGSVSLMLAADDPENKQWLAEQTDGSLALPEELQNFTFTLGWDAVDAAYAQIHLNPQGVAVAQRENLAIEPGIEHDLVFINAYSRLWVYVDGVPIVSWQVQGETGNHNLYLNQGHVGIQVVNADARIEQFRVDQLKDIGMAEIEQVKDLNLETDLGAARIVLGAEATHQRAGQRIADAIAAKTGSRPELVSAADVVEELPCEQPVITLGSMADNAVIRKLYLQWHTMVDSRFPGEGGHVVRTIHDPWGTGANVVMVGASDAAGLEQAVSQFVSLIPADGLLGRLHEVQPSQPWRELARYGEDDPDRYPRLILPVGYPQSYELWRGHLGDPQAAAVIYHVTGDEAWAQRYREQMLAWVERGITFHLYIPFFQTCWDLMEEHPMFSDAERLKITNWLLREVRSKEGVGSQHIQRFAWGMPHQNHGTRPGLGSFFMAQYFRNHYQVPEMEMYLDRIAHYFDMQADWGKPMEDSSWHQYSTLTDKALYALASGNERFFTSGAAKRVAERALRTINNSGVLPLVGDTVYGKGASSFLAAAALYYQDGRYLWPFEKRAPWPRTATDELARSFIGDVKVQEPTDIVGVSVIPYDPGFWEGWRNLPSQWVFNPPNISYASAFDKIAFRSGLGTEDEFLLLEGMVGASHDYDDTNTLHEYSRGERIYLTTKDGLFAPTFAQHNGVNIIRDGLSTRVPYFAEYLNSATFDQALFSRTRVNNFADADWTRTVVLVPGRYFVVLDQMEALKAGTYSFTGNWRVLGEAKSEGDRISVAQWPKDESRTAENTTYFHLDTPGAQVSHQPQPKAFRKRDARLLPFEPVELTQAKQAQTTAMQSGERTWLYALGQETRHEPQPRYQMQSVRPGLMQVRGSGYRALIGEGTQTIGSLHIEAETFHLTEDTLILVGGRRATVGTTPVFTAKKPHNVSVNLATGEVTDAGERAYAAFTLSEADQETLVEVLHRTAQIVAADQSSDSKEPEQAMPEPPSLRKAWTYDAGGRVNYLRSHLGNPGAQVLAGERSPLPLDFGIVAIPSEAGQVSFLSATGEEIRRIEQGAAVNDVAIDDIDRNGSYEILLARADEKLVCLTEAGEERFTFEPERLEARNSALLLRRTEALYVFVAERSKELPKTICVSMGDQHVRALNPAGEEQFEWWSYAGLYNRHGLYDLDGKGVKDIVGGNGEVSSTDAVYFADESSQGGNRKLRLLNDGWGSTLSSMAIADISGDARPELLIGTGKANLYAIDPKRVSDSGKPDYLWSHNLGADVRGCEVIQTQDGPPLVVAASLSGFVTAFDGEGTSQWATSLGSSVSFLTSAMLDGAPVLLAATQSGAVAVLDSSGQLLRRSEIGVSPTALTTSASDEGVFALVADEEGQVHAFEL